MRQIININKDWQFSKKNDKPLTKMPGIFDRWEKIDLPHTWNAEDGQDGGNDYYRGACWYAKQLKRSDLPQADRYFLEFNGANSSAEAYVNGKKLMSHDGGYSTWRVDITDSLENNNVISVMVDNAPNDRVYPQMADFTFYGGLYRDVNIVCVSDTHFDLEYFGGPGIKVTPTVEGKNANIEIEVFVTNMKAGQEISYTVFDKEGNAVWSAKTKDTKVSFDIENVHLWNGRKDPYLYTAKAEIIENGNTLDNVSARFGLRYYKVDPERGFILNGEEYPLRGVSRHQDRWGIGNALLNEHHKEDVDMIVELGCTTIRLAHYQHNQYFYDLCDEAGLVIWAEIPYISKHMPTGRENTISQMKELVTQNYNHASICMWGLSNEITMDSDKDPDMVENHRILNDLCHEMDKTRPTTIAAVTMCDIHSPYIQIPDLVSYNHYFGWYGGEVDMNGPWFDEFHKEFPNIPIGISEYGAEALNWHTSNPTQGDYTEEYQAYYHEEMIKQLFSRPFIWATHCWNMFDFGADARSEGGENGQNHKGLVTIDRKYKKDAFYAYKAWLSDDPFVHIASKRYVDRVEPTVTVTVYSNQKEVELFANGVSCGKKTAEDHFFRFEVENKGETVLKAVAGECTDESKIRKVEKFNEDYRLKETGSVINWFEITAPEGYFSINDKLSDIMKSEEGAALFKGLMAQMMPKDGTAAGFKVTPNMMKLVGGFTVLRLTSMVGMANVNISKEQILGLNAMLNKIKKP
ncbi:MAG: glycoside hydrolase family 2 protein [Clostridiales bacterium]|nr:glycoside hydrolase family 2 protein [Clostridiales bacterium]